MTQLPNLTREQLETLDEESLITLVLALQEQMAEMMARIQGLEDQQAKNSGNSSKPPSSDGFNKPKTKSLRKRGQRKSGGQAGHKGETLKQVAVPDKVLRHGVAMCRGCETDLSEVSVEGLIKRQVFDVPVIQLEVSEHQAEIKTCPCCGKVVRAPFPADVSSPVQYGPRVQAQMVYLNSYQLLPWSRIGDYFEDCYGQRPSEATIANALKKLDEGITPALDQIYTGLIKAGVVNYDETGLRVAGERSWLHVASTAHLTYYLVHKKRGDEAMLDMGVLPNSRGWAVHDGFKTYFTFKTCRHALCNAHHLRELQFLVDQYQQGWAQELIDLLLTIKQHIGQMPDHKRQLAPEMLTDFAAQYDALITRGFELNPIQPRPPNHNRRMKQSAATNLLIRLQTHRDAVLAFMYDLRVPFDNNLAERDIRMMKVKQKISGTFRTWPGAEQFAAIRAYISTVRKQGRAVLQAFYDALMGDPFIPAIPE